jgi:hypothetical protein
MTTLRKFGRRFSVCSNTIVRQGASEELNRKGRGKLRILVEFCFCAHILALILIIEGCAPRPMAPPAGVLPRELSREEWLTRFRQRADYWSMYQAALRIRAESPKAKNRFQALALAKPPNRFRLEATSPFGQTVAVFVLSPQEASLWAPSEKTLFTADNAQTLIEYFLGGAIPPDVFEYGLVASIPPNLLDDNFHITPSASGWLAYTQDPQRSLSFVWELTRQPLTLSSIGIRGGQESYTIRYEPPVGLEDIASAPEKIVFSSKDWQMEVSIQQIEKPLQLQDATFAPPFSQGIRVVNLDRIR